MQFCLSIGLAGCRKTETRTFEFEDDTPELEIEKEIEAALIAWRDEEIWFGIEKEK